MNVFTSKYQQDDLLTLMRLHEEVGETPCMSFPDAFFPNSKDHYQAMNEVRWAKEACGRCPLMNECLEYALKWEPEFGIWGGTSPRERQKLAPRRPRKVA